MTLEREEWLALAQSGQMTAAEPHLAELLADPQGDGAEICEAFVVGYLKLRNFTAASELLDAWSRDYPRDAQTHYWRGLMDMDLLSPSSAEEQLRLAVELSPKHADALYWLADLLLDGGRTEEALGYFERVSRLKPDDLAAAVGRASCLRRVDRSAEARALLERVLTVSANDAALVELANLDIESGDYESARERLEPAVKANPQQKDLRYVYGIALRNLGRMDEAQEHFKFVVEVNKRLDLANVLADEALNKPGDADLRYQIGELHLHSGSEKEGLVWLESCAGLQSAAQADPPPLGGILHQQGRRRSQAPRVGTTAPGMGRPAGPESGAGVAKGIRLRRWWTVAAFPCCLLTGGHGSVFCRLFASRRLCRGRLFASRRLCRGRLFASRRLCRGRLFASRRSCQGCLGLHEPLGGLHVVRIDGERRAIPSHCQVGAREFVGQVA